MSYCTKCGAYIPDVQTRCLACGFDEAAEKSSGSAAARKQKSDTGFSNMNSEELRRELEYQRKKKQEEHRRWAEAEYERRRAAESSGAKTDERPEQPMQHDTALPDQLVRLMSAASYISVLFILPYIFASDNSFARFHAKQGLGLFIFGAVADVIGSIFPLAWLLWLIRIYCIYKGVTGALSGQTEPLPLLGKYIK